MLTKTEQERIKQLEAKAYFEWGLSETDSQELDALIAKAQPIPPRDIGIHCYCGQLFKTMGDYLRHTH